MNTNDVKAARSAGLRKPWSTIGGSFIAVGIGWSLGSSWFGATAGGSILSSMLALIHSDSVIYKIPGVLLLLGLIGLLVGAFRLAIAYFS